ncbi:hypothetical protein [Burkholderia sp. BCC0044]|uniref:hypothetical protein n=1 Tax=Burkholderia sp. BCC0044 TaxID=2676295 RepID=UPI00158882A2|nr:hypothetical protein [Burkholderia sp. BCC0044]
MGSNPASRATLKGLSSGKALFLFAPPLPLVRTIAHDAFGKASATSHALSAAPMKTAAIGRRPSIIESARRGARQRQ